MLELLYVTMAIAMIVSAIAVATAVLYHILAWQGHYKATAWDGGAAAAHKINDDLVSIQSQNPYRKGDN